MTPLILGRTAASSDLPEELVIAASSRAAYYERQMKDLEVRMKAQGLFVQVLTDITGFVLGELE